MANPDKETIFEAVVEAAMTDARDWDTEEAWRAASGALVEMIEEIGATLSDPHLTVLLGIAAMSFRRSTLVTHEQLIMEAL